MKKILNIITSVLVAVVVLLAILLVGVRLAGINVYAVLSGSMEPTYHTGSVIYVKDVDPFKLETGDVITFMLDEDTLVTHRIVDIIPDEEEPSTIRFQTKGDANDAIDGSLVHYKNIVGTPVFTIPYLGYFSNFIQNPPGTYYAITFVVILLLLAFIPDLFDEGKSKAKEKEQKTKQKKKHHRGRRRRRGRNKDSKRNHSAR